MSRFLKVLLVEDCEDDALLLIRALKKGGYDTEYTRVDTMESFSEALGSDSWDLVISDYSMEGFTGLDALRVFNDSNLHIPFILISGTIGEELAVRSMKMGAHDYLMKDNLRRLVPAVERELREAEARKENIRVNRELRITQERLATAFRTSIDSISIAKASTGEFIEVNQGFERIFGFSMKEVAGSTSRDLHIWLSDEERDAFVIPVSQKGVVRDLETRMGTRSGNIIYVNLSAELVDIAGEKCILAFAQDITERRKAEIELAREKQLWQSLFDNSPEGVVLMDREGRLEKVNPGFSRIFGYEAEEVTGRDLDEVVCCSSEMIEEALALTERVISGQNIQSEGVRCRKDGSSIPVSMHGIPLDLPESNIAMYGIYRDISEEKQAREQIKQEKDYWKMLFENSPEGIVVTDRNQLITRVNQEFCHIFGYCPEEVIGQDLDEMVGKDPDIFSEAIDFSKKSLKEGKRVFGDSVRNRKDGSRVDVSILGVPMFLEGEFISGLGIYRDISRRKETEKALTASESRLRNIVENANQIIFSLRTDGTLSFVSPAWARIMGYRDSETLGKHFLEFVHPEDVDIGRDAMERISRDGTLKSAVTLRMKRKSGDWRWLRSVGSRFYSSSEEVLYGGIAEDITERKEAEDQLRETYARLETLIEAIPDVVFLKDRQGYVLAVNTAYEQETGLDRSIILGKKDDTFLPEELAKQSIVSDRKILKDREKVTVEDTWTVKGTRKYYQTTKVPLLNNEGEISGIVGISRDISDIRNAEERYRGALYGAINTMSKIVEIRDPYTAGHQSRASGLAVDIAKEMGLDNDQCEGLRVASLLYEIGKINVPSEILNKPGKISEMEYELIQEHPGHAYEILKNINFPWPVARIVYQHHERMDGSGYPQHVKGDDICIEARILAVADVIEAMCSHRPYRPSLGIDKALEEVCTQQGILYDREVVQAVLSIFSDTDYKQKW